MSIRAHHNARLHSKTKKTLIYDNCDVQGIWWKPNSYATAEHIGKMLGNYTETVNSVGTNAGQSWQSSAGSGQHSSSTTTNSGSNENWSVMTRPLLRPEELLTADDNYLIAFTKRTRCPIWAKRIKYYSDPAFTPARKS